MNILQVKNHQPYHLKDTIAIWMFFSNKESTSWNVSDKLSYETVLSPKLKLGYTLPVHMWPSPAYPNLQVQL